MLSDSSLPWAFTLNMGATPILQNVIKPYCTASHQRRKYVSLTLRLSSVKTHSLFQILEIGQCDGTVDVDQCVKHVAVAVELNAGWGNLKFLFVRDWAASVQCLSWCDVDVVIIAQRGATSVSGGYESNENTLLPLTPVKRGRVPWTQYRCHFKMPPP